MRNDRAEIAAHRAERDKLFASTDAPQANANASSTADRTSADVTLCADATASKESLQPKGAGDATIESPRDSVQRRGQARGFIAELIQSLPQGTHITACEVYERVQQAGLNLSLSTVYRTLGLLKAQGVVQALSGEHGSRYEAHDDDHDHDHLICLSCGFTVEFVDDLLKGFGQVLAKRNGYEFKRSRFDLYGLCQECQAKSSEFKIRQTVSRLQTAGVQMERYEITIASATSHFEARRLDRGCEAVATMLQELEQLQSELRACLDAFTPVKV
jgi:Fur family ferric uptake transcriptional regulator